MYLSIYLFIYLQHFPKLNFVSCFHIKKFISSSEVSAFDCVLQSDLLAAFWPFSIWLMMFLSTFCFSEPFPFLILERSLLEKQEQVVPLLCVPCDEIGTCFDAS